MFDTAQNASVVVPVRLVSNTDGITPVVGLTTLSIISAVAKSDGTVTTFGVNTLTFTELTTGAFMSTGTYHVTIPSSVTDVLGALIIVITSASSKPYEATVNVVAPSSDAAVLAVLGTPSVSVSADIAAVKSDTGTIKTNVGTALQVLTGRWKIFTTGGSANQLVMYGDDDTTPIFTFDLLDSAGSPTSSSPFERSPA